MRTMQFLDAQLVLEDGTVFPGHSVGADGVAAGHSDSGSRFAPSHDRPAPAVVWSGGDVDDGGVGGGALD